MTLLSIESLKPARATAANIAVATMKTVTRKAWTVAVAWNRRRALAEFAQMDARMLADLGLARGDVAAAASEPLWRDPTTRLSVLAIERRAAERDYARWRTSKAAEMGAAAKRGRRGRDLETCVD